VRIGEVSGMCVNAIAVAVLADDPITRADAIARLSMYHQVSVLDVDQERHAEVLLVLTAEVDVNVLSRMERAYRQSVNGDLSVVLVAARIPEKQVLRAITSGLVCLLRRHEVGFDRIVQAVIAARDGRAELPGVTQRFLVDQLRTIRHNVLAPLDPTVTRFAAREVDVLRLLSEGLDTGEVAVKLNYSERTVKNILHGVLTRFKLRNRTQAVAFAFRSGALKGSGDAHLDGSSCQQIVINARARDEDPLRGRPARLTPNGEITCCPTPSSSGRLPPLTR
jgi:DNA-binding NarL/FixJ family response regulator